MDEKGRFNPFSISSILSNSILKEGADRKEPNRTIALESEHGRADSLMAVHRKPELVDREEVGEHSINPWSKSSPQGEKTEMPVYFWPKLLTCVFTSV